MLRRAAIKLLGEIPFLPLLNWNESKVVWNFKNGSQIRFYNEITKCSPIFTGFHPADYYVGSMGGGKVMLYDILCHEKE